MKTDRLKEMYVKYELTKDDVFKHQHYIIITRSGIDKIQATSKIEIHFEVIKCEKDFCVVKANGSANGKSILILILVEVYRFKLWFNLNTLNNFDLHPISHRVFEAGDFSFV